MRKQTSFERATLEYDHEHERALIEAIAAAIFEASMVSGQQEHHELHDTIAGCA